MIKLPPRSDRNLSGDESELDDDVEEEFDDVKALNKIIDKKSCALDKEKKKLIALRELGYHGLNQKEQDELRDRVMDGIIGLSHEIFELKEMVTKLSVFDNKKETKEITKKTKAESQQVSLPPKRNSNNNKNKSSRKTRKSLPVSKKRTNPPRQAAAQQKSPSENTFNKENASINRRQGKGTAVKKVPSASEMDDDEDYSQIELENLRDPELWSHMKEYGWLSRHGIGLYRWCYVLPEKKINGELGIDYLGDWSIVRKLHLKAMESTFLGQKYAIDPTWIKQLMDSEMEETKTTETRRKRKLSSVKQNDKIGKTKERKLPNAKTPSVKGSSSSHEEPDAELNSNESNNINTKRKNAKPVKTKNSQTIKNGSGLCGTVYWGTQGHSSLVTIVDVLKTRKKDCENEMVCQFTDGNYALLEVKDFYENAPNTSWDIFLGPEIQTIDKFVTLEELKEHEKETTDFSQKVSGFGEKKE